MTMPTPTVTDPQPPAPAPAPGTIPVVLPPVQPAAALPLTINDIERIQREAVERVQAEAAQRQAEADARLAALQQEVASLSGTAEQQRQAAEAAAREEEARQEAARQAALTEQQRLAEGQQSMQAQLQQMQEQIALRDAMILKQDQFASLQAYRARRLAEEAEHIMPTLADFVAGDTEAAIESSIEIVKQKTAETVGQMQQAQRNMQIAQPHAAPSGVPPVGGPMEQIDGQINLSADDIRNMPMSQWAQLRPQLLGAAGEAYQQSRGMFA